MSDYPNNFNQMPPQQPTPKPKKAWYTKWWIWVIIALVLAGAATNALTKSGYFKKADSPYNSSIVADQALSALLN
ncbi:MAG: hypothetical protein WBA28_05580 [Microbacteriaceae bacterium]